MAWMVCIGVVLAAVCLLQANCQKVGTSPECSAQESGTVRFYGIPKVFDNRTEGQVLVCENGFWSRICDVSGGWTEEDAKVVCRELGFNAGEPMLILNQLWAIELPAVSSTTPSCNGSESTLADCVAVPLDQSTDCDNVAVEVTCSRPVPAAAPTSIAPSTSDSIADSVDTETQVPMSSIHPHSTETEGSVNKSSALPSSQASSPLIGFHTSLPKPDVPAQVSESAINTIALGAGVTGWSILLIVVGVLVALTVLVCRRRIKSEPVSVATATNPAYEIPQTFTNRGDHFNMANQASLGRHSTTMSSTIQRDNNNVDDEGYETMYPASQAVVTAQQTETLSEGYIYDNEEEMPQLANPAYTADIHVYDVISDSTPRPRSHAQTANAEHDSPILPECQPNEEYEMMSPPGVCQSRTQRLQHGDEHEHADVDD